MRNLHLALYLTDTNAYRAAVLETDKGIKEYYQPLKLDGRLVELDYLRGSLMWAANTAATHRGTVNYTVVPALEDEVQAVYNFPRLKAARVNHTENLAIKVLSQNLAKIDNPAEPVQA